ncbi:MAG TPA: alpha/beta hydrolase family protein, partial [Terracidiphilus sp.]|nr:alpha/beta hydrolase family protein [Terracidiphilus sp.]
TSMLKERYARWMYEWETRLTTRDENRVVRPLEWGFEWIEPFLETHGFASAIPGPEVLRDNAAAEAAMVRINQLLTRHSDKFFGYERPADFRLEERHPMLFPTNVRPETLAQDAALRAQAEAGAMEKAQFLRFTSPERTPYPENDTVNARWFPAPAHKDPQRPRQAIVVLPQWNADAFSHNALCAVFNKFGVSALRLSKPYHDIRRPAELERSDYAVSANIGRTISACRQAVVDIRCCLDWLEEQGYEHFGVLGTSLGSCYAFLASAHDRRIRVNAFNHASTAFGDVVWAGQSTRHIRQGLEEAGLTQERLRALWSAVSPVSFYDRFASEEVDGLAKKILLVYAEYDLTFPREYSLEVVKAFRRVGLNFRPRVLPCGHYTTGETPYKYIDGWYLGSFVWRAFKELRAEKAAGRGAAVERLEEEAVSR